MLRIVLSILSATVSFVVYFFGPILKAMRMHIVPKIRNIRVGVGSGALANTGRIIELPAPMLMLSSQATARSFGLFLVSKIIKARLKAMPMKNI